MREARREACFLCMLIWAGGVVLFAPLSPWVRTSEGDGAEGAFGPLSLWFRRSEGDGPKAPLDLYPPGSGRGRKTVPKAPLDLNPIRLVEKGEK